MIIIRVEGLRGVTKEAMEDIGLQWNPKKCNVLNVRRGVPVDIPEGFKSGETLIDSLKEDTTYRFLEHRNGYFKKKSWLCSVLPRPTCRDSRLSGRAHSQTSTEFTLDLTFPHPKCRDNTDGADVPRDKIKRHLKKAAMEQRKTEVKEEK